MSGDDPYFHVEVDPVGDMRFRGLTPVLVDTLLRLPTLLRSDDPDVRARLLPPTYSDQDDAEQWRRFAHPELEHLFAGRIEIIEHDLLTMRSEGEYGGASLLIPARHRHAWLSALNAARLTLYLEAGLDAEDMGADLSESTDFDRDVVLLRIHLLGFLQEMLLEAHRAPEHAKYFEPGDGDDGDDADSDDAEFEDWDLDDDDDDEDDEDDEVLDDDWLDPDDDARPPTA